MGDDNDILVNSATHSSNNRANYRIFDKLSLSNIAISPQIIRIIIVVICIISWCGSSISLPIVSQAILTGNCPSNQYFTLLFNNFWFPIVFWLCAVVIKLINPSFSFKSYTSHKVLALLGLLDTISAFMVVYASPPDRTLPSLQAILRTLKIPYTVLLSYIVLRKRPSLGRFICTCGTLIGLFISLEPIVFNINGQHREKGIASVLWPFVFGLASLPSSLMSVLQERHLKKDVKVIDSNLFYIHIVYSRIMLG